MYTCCSLNLNIAVSNQQIVELGRACVEFGFMRNFRNPFDAILHSFVHLGMISFFPMKIFLASYIIFEVSENGLSFVCALAHTTTSLPSNCKFGRICFCYCALSLHFLLMFWESNAMMLCNDSIKPCRYCSFWIQEGLTALKRIY